MLAVALAVRLAGLNFESFSMDEVTDLRIARLPVQQIVRLADGFPPLYHLLLKGWLMVWGTPLAARWLSVLLGLVTVYAVYQLALATAGRPAAIAGSMLIAISPLHVWFAQESRAYALALPLAAVALWRFHRALTTNMRRDWLIYAGVALAAVCSHYFLAIVVALQALWFLPRLVRPGVDRHPALAAYGFLALSALPVLVLLRSDLAFQSGKGDGTIDVGMLLYTPYVFLLGFSTGPSLRELHGRELQQAAVAALPWIAALAACMLPLGISWLRRARPSFEGAAYLLVMCLGPIAVTVVLSSLFEFKNKFSYIAWASIPLLVMLGDVIVRGWDRWSTRAAAAGYLCLMLVALGNRHLVDRYRTEDVRSLATYLEAHSSRETPIFSVAWYMADPLIFYLGAEWTVKALPRGPAALFSIAELTGPAAAGPAWIVYRRPFPGDPNGKIRARLAADTTIRLSARFAGLDLYRFEPAEKDPARW